MQRAAQQQSVLSRLLKPEPLNNAERQHQQHGQPRQHGQPQQLRLRQCKRLSASAILSTKES
jgi:hypothetical protein